MARITLARPRSTTSTDGYFRLAVAVLALAIDEAQHGTPTQRAAARRDIEHGGLEHWVDAVSINRGVRGRIKEILRDVAQQP